MRDQTIKADAGKRRLSLVPAQICYDIAEVREYGEEKYGTSESWKRVEIERYIDALYRHLLAYIENRKGVDAESGIKHYKHLACNAAFICALEANEDEMCEKYKKKLNALNERAEEIYSELDELFNRFDISEDEYKELKDKFING